MEELMDKGCAIDYHDPFISEIRLNDGSRKQSVPFTKEQINQYDVIIIHTDHDVIDYSILKDASPIIFDTRNVCRKNQPTIAELSLYRRERSLVIDLSLFTDLI